MKKLFLSLGVCAATALLCSGCASDSAKQTTPTTAKPLASEPPSVVWSDSVVKKSVTALGAQVGKTADGRMKVTAQFRNTENRRIEVQANCVFKDAQGLNVDETPFRTVLLDENATQRVMFETFNLSATNYTIHVRQAR